MSARGRSTGVEGPWVLLAAIRLLPSVLLPGKQAAFAEDVFAEFVFEAVAQKKSRVGGVADAELCDHLFVQAAARKVFAGAGAFGAAKAVLKERDGALMDVEELAAESSFLGFAFVGVGGFGQRDAELLCNESERIPGR